MVSFVCFKVLRYVFLSASKEPDVSIVSSREPTSIKKPKFTTEGKLVDSVTIVNPFDNSVTLNSVGVSLVKIGSPP